MVQWAGAQVTASTVWLTSNRQFEGTIGRVADTAHTGSFITRHSHLKPSMDSHRAINTNDIQAYAGLYHGQLWRISRQLLE